jgi:hypothetical protein
MTSSAAVIVSIVSERFAKAISAQRLSCRMRRKTHSQPSSFRSSKTHTIARRPFSYWSPMALKVAWTLGVRTGSRYRRLRLLPPDATDVGAAQPIGAYDIPQFNRRQGYQSEIGYVLMMVRRAGPKGRSPGHSDRRNRSKTVCWLAWDLRIISKTNAVDAPPAGRPTAAFHLTIFTPLSRAFAPKS